MDDYEDIPIIYRDLSQFCEGMGRQITILDVEEALRTLIAESLVNVFRPDQRSNIMERQSSSSFGFETDVSRVYFFRSQSGKKVIESLPEDWFDSINSRFTLSSEE